MTDQFSSRKGIAILRLKQVIERTGISRSTIYNWMDPKSHQYDSTFPLKVAVGPGAIGWVESEIDAWLSSRVSANRPAVENALPAIQPPIEQKPKKRILATKMAVEPPVQDELRLAKVRQFLVDQIKKGATQVYYEQVMATIRLWADEPADREVIERLLEEISRTSHVENGILLGVLVCDKKSGVIRPSDHFYDLAKSLGYCYDDSVKFAEMQALRLYEYYETPEKKAKGRLTRISGKDGRISIFRM